MKLRTLFFLVVSVLGFSMSAYSAQEIKVRMVAVELNGTKFWLPSTITAHKGDTLVLEAVSAVPGKNAAHGLKIADFSVEEVITKEKKTIKIQLDKAGVFPITCHLHPAHIGGQLVVLE